MRVFSISLLSLTLGCASTWSGTSASRDGRVMEASELAAGLEAGGENQEGSQVQERPTEAGVLTAGRWRDLDDWARFQKLYDQEGVLESFATSYGFAVNARVPVVVKDAEGRPVVDAEVALFSAREEVVWRARTDNHGRAELFGGVFAGRRAAGPYGVEVKSRGQRATQWDVRAGDRVAVQLDAKAQERRALDLMFVVDTTGSMGDELRFLQRELDDVVRRVKEKQSLDVRLSVNFYRDHGDAYVVRANPFTAKIDHALEVLRAQDANGGGDTPEAVDEALVAALDHQWSNDATARLCFLVLDASPHQGERERERIERAVTKAAALGVRLVPIASSGVARDTEALLRAAAAATGGEYVFLTDHSGIGNSHLEPTVGPYDVQLLNELLVELIDDYTKTVDAPALAKLQ